MPATLPRVRGGGRAGGEPVPRHRAAASGAPRGRAARSALRSAPAATYHTTVTRGTCHPHRTPNGARTELRPAVPSAAAAPTAPGAGARRRESDRLASRIALGADIVRRQVSLSSAVLSPAGDLVAYCRRTVAGNRYRTNLWLVPYEGGAPRRLTNGRWSDSAPVWSPDGRWLAYLSNRGRGSDAALYLLDVASGRERQVCAPEGGASWPAFSPDGRLIAFVAPAGEPRFWIGDPKRRLGRVIREVDWRSDEGERVRRAHLFVVAARASARPRQLTRGEFDVSSPAWHPDGSRIAFKSDLEPGGDVRASERLYEVEVEGGTPRELLRLDGRARWPAFSAAGALAATGTQEADAPSYAEDELFLAEGGGARSLSAALDAPVMYGDASDLHDWAAAERSPFVWDGSRLVAVVHRRGRDEVWSFDPHGERRRLLQGDQTLASLSAVRGRLVCVGAQGPEAPEVCAVEEGAVRRLTRHGGDWLRRLGGARVLEVDADGVPCFLVEPPAADGPAALVLHPHGGPYGSHSPTPSLDDLVLASRGYRVLLPNIRGSAGYGSSWVRAAFGRWGGPDAEDLLRSVEWAIEQDLADPDRVAAFGLSYGGWAVNWLVGVSDRFACAISENGVANMVAAHAVSCIGPPFDRRVGYGPVPEFADPLWACSPLRNAEAVTTPLLMLQGEADRICPLDDTWQLFVALRELGRDVEMVLYPDEHHVMRAIGRPDRRADRMERVLAFLARHCPP